MKTDVLIIGGGISGLCVAHSLVASGIDCHLLEARERVGGRVLSLSLNHNQHQASAFDLGPSWFWPGQQRLLELLVSLDMQSQIFKQPSEGSSVMEYANGIIERSGKGASMQGAYRLHGGIGALSAKLRSTLPDSAISLNSKATSINSRSTHVSVSYHTETKNITNNKTQTNTLETVSNNTTEKTVTAKMVVLALPPRLAADSLSFDPPLPSDETLLMESVPTWMAAQAKFVAVYKTPFWKQLGLSGDAFSQLGPLFEIHDASDNNSDSESDSNNKQPSAALFGFIGTPLDKRKNNALAIEQSAKQQLVRLFGEPAADPLQCFYKDWAQETATSTDTDRQQQAAHARRTTNSLLQNDPRLIWAGSETATTGGHSNGFLEGAVESALRGAKLVQKQLR